MSEDSRERIPRRVPVPVPNRTYFLTPQQVNRKRIRAGLIGLALLLVGFPFLVAWEGSTPPGVSLDFLLGWGLVFAGAVCLGAAGLNRVGRNWWSDATQEDGPMAPI